MVVIITAGHTSHAPFANYGFDLLYWLRDYHKKIQSKIEFREK